MASKLLGFDKFIERDVKPAVKGATDFIKRLQLIPAALVMILAGWYIEANRTIPPKYTGDAFDTLIYWPIVLYGLASILSKERDIVDRMASSALWFAVSRPVGLGLGNSGTSTFSDKLAHLHSTRDYTSDRTYHIEIGPSNILELPRTEVQRLSRLCAEFTQAKSVRRSLFTVGWALVVASRFIPGFNRDIDHEAIFVCAACVLWWGTLPRRSMAYGYEQLSPTEHLHVYEYSPVYTPADGELDAHLDNRYVCACGKNILRQEIHSNDGYDAS